MRRDIDLRSFGLRYFSDFESSDGMRHIFARLASEQVRRDFASITPPDALRADATRSFGRLMTAFIPQMRTYRRICDD
jgi:hypothetical protein